MELAVNRKGGRATQIDPLTTTPHHWAQSQSYRHDMLYYGVSDIFYSPSYNWDYVNPATIAVDDVLLIAAHSTNVPMDMEDNSRINNHFALMQAMKYKAGPLYSSQFHPDTGSCLSDPPNQRIVKNFVMISMSHLVRKWIAGWSATSEFDANWTAGMVADLDKDTAWCSTAADSAPSVTVGFAEPTAVRYLLVVEGYDDTGYWAPTGYVFRYKKKGDPTWHVVPHSVSSFTDLQVKALAFPNDGYWCGVDEFKGTPTAADWRLGQGDSCAYSPSDKITYNGAAKKVICTNGETVVHTWQELGGASDGHEHCSQKGGQCTAVRWLFCRYATNYAHGKLVTFTAAIRPETLRIETARGADGVCLSEVLLLPDLTPP